MSREIAYRIWNPEEKKFIESGFTPKMLASFFDYTARFHTFYKEEYQEFTGLHDKNGKEIYEGDIVTGDGYIWFDEGEPNYRATVEWDVCSWIALAYCVNPKKAGISTGIGEGLDEHEWTILGNIHETPELLK